MVTGSGTSEAQSLSSMLTLDLANSNITVCLASVTATDQLPVFSRLIVSDSLADEFRKVARGEFDRRSKDLASADLVIHSYDPGAKLEPYEVEYIDLSQQPMICDQFASLQEIGNVPPFQEDEHFLSGLRFYVIILQPLQSENVYCFRSYTPKRELSRSHLFGALFAGGHFDRVNNPMFLFDAVIDCASCGDDLFIFKKDAFQKIFRFFDLVRKAAKKALLTIRKAIPIDNFDEFEKSCEGHLQKLAKLNNIASKPYLTNVTMADLRKVIKTFSLHVTTTKKGGKEMLVFDPSDKWALLKLLDDDYLGSIMTGQNYEVTGKRTVQQTQQQ